MDWMLVILLAVQGAHGAEQHIERREAVRSELACHTAIMRHLDAKGHRVLEAECLNPRAARQRLVNSSSGTGVQVASRGAETTHNR
jgi:hypothetical protein